MLYNPDWNYGDADKKAYYESLCNTENFVKWLGEQPRDKTYKYVDPCNCAVAQYFRAHGINKISGPDFEKSLGWHKIVFPGSVNGTFGKAYDRAVGSTPVTRSPLVRWFKGLFT